MSSYLTEKERAKITLFEGFLFSFTSRVDLSGPIYVTPRYDDPFSEANLAKDVVLFTVNFPYVCVPPPQRVSRIRLS